VTTEAMEVVEIVADPIETASLVRQRVTARDQQVVEAHELGEAA
jgi:hypothetical protein